MGVETIAYSVPPEKMRKLKRNFELLDKLSHYAQEEMEADWDFESFSFSKGWEETIEILRTGGFPLFGKKLNHENFWDCDYEVWSVTPKAAQRVADHLKGADFEELKRIGLENKLTDYWGQEIHEQMYSYYIGDI